MPLPCLDVTPDLRIVRDFCQFALHAGWLEPCRRRAGWRSCVTGNIDRRCRQQTGVALVKPAESKRRKRGGGATTLRMRDVARKAGVSVMTVSRALNDPDKVSEEMRQRVRAVVEEIGYVPNRLARSLSSNRSNMIGLIVPS